MMQAKGVDRILVRQHRWARACPHSRKLAKIAKIDGEEFTHQCLFQSSRFTGARFEWKQKLYSKSTDILILPDRADCRFLSIRHLQVKQKSHEVMKTYTVISSFV